MTNDQTNEFIALQPPVQTSKATRKGRGPTVPRWQIATAVTLHEAGDKFKNEAEALRMIEAGEIDEAWLVRKVEVKIERTAKLA